jgi:hypothetical protein
MHTHQKSCDPIATIGLDIGKTTFHLVGLDKRGAIAASVTLLGQYTAGQFTSASDGQGGTLIGDPPLTVMTDPKVTLMTPPHA